MVVILTRFSSLLRNEMFKKLQEEPLDILIIGGGITGAGIALDAVTRGMKTGLVEMQDFAAGTSSRSTKLVHGGLRYLQQFEIKLVAEVGKEREVVYENGPHVTTPEWMLLPFHEGGTFGPVSTNVGLLAYDLLAGVKRSERRTMLKPEEVAERVPLIKRGGLKGGGHYVEYKTDDARLTIEVMKQAVHNGAHAINYAMVVDFIYSNSMIIGVVVEDQISRETYKIYAKKVINAAGPWVDELRDVDESKEDKTLHLTKGVHLVFNKKDFPLDQAVYFDAPDGRMIFAIPRDGITYVGTTDTDYNGDIAHPLVTPKDRDYLLSAIHFMFPTLDLTAKDVVSSWAGLRPLIAEEGKDPDEISRKDEVFISDSGLISIAGGKLTGYRKMAEEVVDLVAKQLKKEAGILYSKSNTKQMPISGGEVGGSRGFELFKHQKIEKAKLLKIDEKAAKSLIERYGSNVDQVLLFIEEIQHDQNEEIDPIVYAELLYALEYECAYKPEDFFVRRTGALFFDIDWVRKHKENVIRLMAEKLDWTKERREKYEEDLQKMIKDALISETK